MLPKAERFSPTFNGTRVSAARTLPMGNSVINLWPHNAMNHSVNIRVNGVPRKFVVEPRLLLVHFLRDRCGLTGTHVGCETTLCGACTVLLNNKAVKSCTVLAVQADGLDVTTIEGLAANGQLHPVQESFKECHGLQCGFCTPGMILSSVQLLKENPKPSRKEITHALDGNLCRCTGYSHIIDSVEHAAKKLRVAEKRRAAQATPEPA